MLYAPFHITLTPLRLYLCHWFPSSCYSFWVQESAAAWVRWERLLYALGLGLGLGLVFRAIRVTAFYNTLTLTLTLILTPLPQIFIQCKTIPPKKIFSKKHPNSLPTTTQIHPTYHCPQPTEPWMGSKRRCPTLSLLRYCWLGVSLVEGFMRLGSSQAL